MVNNSINQMESVDGINISLINVINFLQDAWRKLVIAGLIGLLLGLGGWWLFASYSATYVLLNNTTNTNTNTTNTNTSTNASTSTSTNTNTYALDIVSWKTLQKSLPNLAAQIFEAGKAPEGNVNLYKTMSKEQWWQVNIIPSYAISKLDTKDIAGAGKDFDAASTTILNLAISAEGRTESEALNNVNDAGKFLRTGGAYLQMRNILNNYESDAQSGVAEIQKKITSIEIEIKYQTKRVKDLEDLHKRFPSNAVVSNQVLDLKESGAKYMPITTQIIAANNDINQGKESLQRLRDRLEQIALLKTFLSKATPLFQVNFDGLMLVTRLLEIEEGLRLKVSKDDMVAQEILDQLHAQLLQVRSRFTIGLEANSAPTLKRVGMVKSALYGFIGALLIALFLLLSHRLLKKIKSGDIKTLSW